MTTPKWATYVMVMMVYSCSLGASPVERREEFVRAFIQSIVNGADFHVRFVSDEDCGETAWGSRRISGVYTITGHDEFPFGGVEYYLLFSNGRRATLDFIEKDGKVISAGLTVDPTSEELVSPEGRAITTCKEAALASQLESSR